VLRLFYRVLSSMLCVRLGSSGRMGRVAVVVVVGEYLGLGGWMMVWGALWRGWECSWMVVLALYVVSDSLCEAPLTLGRVQWVDSGRVLWVIESSVLSARTR